MACASSSSYSSLFLLFFVTLNALLLSESRKVPAIFIFGDSTVDVGTNNFLPKSFAKANYSYYGIDYPGHKPTGRFSNGYNTADLVAQELGFQESPPPFLYLLTRNASYFNKLISRGVNFASAGAGILNNTGLILGEVVSMEEQVEQFVNVINNLKHQKGLRATQQLLAKSMILISIGSNDLFEFFSSAKTHPTPAQSIEFFINVEREFGKYIKLLFNLGARKFGIVSPPLLGCCPVERVQNNTGGCMEDLNRFSGIFYSTIGSLLSSLSLKLNGMKYSFGNTNEMVLYFLQNAHDFGFEEVKSPCCGSTTVFKRCAPNLNLCSNRREYLFWDLYHPTEAASKLATSALFTGSSRFVSPINFYELAKS